jgi:hypothetical protein
VIFAVGAITQPINNKAVLIKAACKKMPITANSNDGQKQCIR